MVSDRSLSSSPDASIDADEAAQLFADLKDAPALLLAVSGGVDSMALLSLAAAWRPAGRSTPAVVFRC
jgi:tRNA(Ile)-lysidine synthase